MTLERETKEIHLFGYDLLLTERSARAVWDLEEYNKTHPSKMTGDNIYKDCLVVEQGLAYNISQLEDEIKSLKWFEWKKKFELKKKRRIFKRILKVSYLTKKLSYKSQIIGYCKMVLKMDGFKTEKKKTAVKK